ncbi:MAG TPA: serine/threonine-protein kinase [Solirubrobacteraceae bacterium]
MSEPGVGRIEPGDVVGGYVIEAVAGRGGMGVVYRARQEKPDRVVALKVIAPGLAEDPDFRARFERESTIAAQIEHPNVIPVHAVGDDRGVLFIAMRFVAGIDLRSLITEAAPLDPHRAASIVDQVAQALDAAHGHGLVHRDVKPANILLSSAGGRDHVYLTDFGLSRPVDGGQGVTRTGAFLGTIDYVAPEQARGGRVDARTDVYSLGCVLFHALSGTVPFPLETDLDKLYAHGTQLRPSVSQRVPGIPQAFDAVVARAMATDPGDRYPSAGDLGRAALAAARLSAQTRETVVAAEDSPQAGDRSGAATGATHEVPTPTLRRTRRVPPSPPPPTPLPSPPASTPGRRGRLWSTPLRVAAAAVLVVGILGVIRFATGHTPSVGAGRPGFRAFILQQPGAAVRQSPTVSAPSTGQLPYRDVVYVVCTTIGDPVISPRVGKVPPITTPVWDRVRPDGAASAVGYVPDARVETGTSAPVAPPCTPARGPRPPPFHAVIQGVAGLAIQRQPKLTSAVVGHLTNLASVYVACTAIGQAVTGPTLSGGSITSPVWDDVRHETGDPTIGFVPDVWVNTGTARPVVPLC